VHQDGLVHVSALAHTYVKDPRDVVKSGDVVKVRVVEVDEARKRISLTMRLEDKPPGRGDRPREGGGQGQSRDGGRQGQSRDGGGQGRSRDGGRRSGEGGRGVSGGGRGTPAGGAMADALRRAGLAGD
jgi:uncharacterized protein